MIENCLYSIHQSRLKEPGIECSTAGPVQGKVFLAWVTCLAEGKPNSTRAVCMPSSILVRGASWNEFTDASCLSSQTRIT